MVNGSIDLTKQQSIGSIDLKSSTKEPWLLVNGTIDCREQYKKTLGYGQLIVNNRTKDPWLVGQSTLNYSTK